MIALHAVQFTALVSFVLITALYSATRVRVNACEVANIAALAGVALATAALALPATSLAFLAGAACVATLACAILAPSILDLATLARDTSGERPRDYAEWELLADDSFDAWPTELTRPRGVDFSPPIHFSDFIRFQAEAREELGADLDTLPALAVAARLLDIRRAMFGETDAADESTYLVEAACFLAAAGHGTARARSQETERATPVVAHYPRATVPTSVSVPVCAYGDTVCA